MNLKKNIFSVKFLLLKGPKLLIICVFSVFFSGCATKFEPSQISQTQN